jgi:hypothetical protein
VGRKALSQELTAEHRSANRLLAGARSGKAFVNFVASWRAA